jgi:hypothetical protein
MRINDTPPVNITRPEARGPVAGVAAGSAVGSRGGNPAVQNLAEHAEPPQPAQTAAERREQARRAEERRKQQMRVLIDTRVGRRRAAKRRVADDAPASVDVQA